MALAGSTARAGGAAGADEDDPVDPSIPAVPTRPRWWARAWSTIERHPGITTALAGVVVAALNAWWIHGHRGPGALNVDEAGYISQALSNHRNIDLAHPVALARLVLEPSSTGPLVPWLAVPLIVAFGSNVYSVMLVQTIFPVVAAVAVAGIVSHLAGRRAALAGGLVVLGFSPMLQSARSFQYAAALGACMCLALWALLASGRGHRRPQMIAFGVAVALMPLSRSMGISFVPVMAVAALVYLRRDRAGWTNAGISAAAFVAVAGPWLYVSRVALYDWLFGYGYGEMSKFYGANGFGDRLNTRFFVTQQDVRAPLFTLASLIVIASAASLLWWIFRRRSVRSVSTWPGFRRDHLVVLVLLAGGSAVLLTSRTEGTWFELPLELVAVASVASLPSLLGLPLRRAVGVIAVAIALATVAVSLTDQGGNYDLVPGTQALRYRAQGFFYGGLVDKERVIGNVDGRWLSNDAALRREADRDWARVNARVALQIDRYAVRLDGVVATISGSDNIINTNTIALADELHGLAEPPIEVPFSTGPSTGIRPFLTPRSGGSIRLLVLIRSRSQPFPEDRDVPKVRRLALASGWHEVHSIPLPLGGDVEFYFHGRDGGTTQPNG